MKSGLYKTICLAGLALLMLLLSASVSDAQLGCKFDSIPGNAKHILSGTGASITKTPIGGDNNTFILNIQNPDPYIGWIEDDEAGAQSLTCFISYWRDAYDDNARDAVIFGPDPSCASIYDMSYTAATGITATLKRPNANSTPTASDSVVIEINRSCPGSPVCWGKKDFYNCYVPYLTPENKTFIASAPGATLNYANFDAAQMRRSKLNGTTLSFASFAGADLRDVDFDDSVLVYTDFTGANMKDSHGNGAFVYQVTAPNGTVINNGSFQDILNNSATTTTTIRPVPIGVDFLTFSPTATDKTVSFQLVNSVLNDLSQIHSIFLFASGTGTLTLFFTAEPTTGSFENLQYVIFGFAFVPALYPIGTISFTIMGSNSDPAIAFVPFTNFAIGYIGVVILSGTGPNDYPANISVIGTATY